MIEKELPNWSVEEIVNNLQHARNVVIQLEQLKAGTEKDIAAMEARLEELANPKTIENV
jgi:hypothetical protein